MDDGGAYSYNNNSTNQGIVLNTQDFSDDTVEELASALEKKFGFKCKVGKNKGKPIIIIPSGDTGKFVRLIDPYMVDCMRYKLPRSTQ